MANQRALIRLSQAAEDVASGLAIFRDSIPSQATLLTTVISELFALSSTLRKLDNAQLDSRREPSFYRIEGDLRLVLPSLTFTLEDALRMFARARERPVAMVWDDLEHRMRDEEGVRFGERLVWCNQFLEDLYAGLDGYASDRSSVLRRRIHALLETQELHRAAGRRTSAIGSSSSTPRPGSSRFPSYRPVDVPISPVSSSDSWNYGDRGFPPSAPEAPPLSPTYTSSSSNTLESSHTSYSGGYPFDPMAMAVAPPRHPVHWARDVFDGGSPSTLFKGRHQTDDETKCYGSSNPEATRRLDDDGFISVVEIEFDRGKVQIRLYWRPADNRSRILFMAKDSRRRELLYCVPLSHLKAIRKESCIQLCRASRGDGHYRLWANLNFMFYERMVLFYSTFVAMKMQDTHEPLPVALIEEYELHEDEQFGGVIRDGKMLHALRLFCDRTSGVVRLEASPLRGPKEGVPLWTAFITRYATDPDWMALENDGQVSMIALRPPPYVFLAGYTLPRNRSGEYLLQFETPEDADEFVKTWNGFCRSSSR